MELDYNFFRVEKTDLEPKLGRILISDPFLKDTYFKRSVVLLTEHNENGSVGFVLNKQVNLYINDMLQNFPEFKTKVSIGGPVSTASIHFLHTCGDLVPDSIPVLEGIYWGGDFNVIKQLIEKGDINAKQIRFFLGYSGWNPHQLENEISRSCWLVSEMDSSQIMSAKTSTVWKNSLLSMGGKYKIWANFPENPGMN
jgi:putative transcriptional regulator